MRGNYLKEILVFVYNRSIVNNRPKNVINVIRYPPMSDTKQSVEEFMKGVFNDINAVLFLELHY